jgi:sterol desaturase/sphingolipid hydroxylase (fatty acid hydroxylase superfamily)
VSDSFIAGLSEHRNHILHGVSQSYIEYSVHIVLGFEVIMVINVISCSLVDSLYQHSSSSNDLPDYISSYLRR